MLGEAERLAKRLYEQDLRVNPVRQWNDVPVPESFVGRKALRHEAAPLLLPTVAMRYEIKVIEVIVDAHRDYPPYSGCKDNITRTEIVAAFAQKN